MTVAAPSHLTARERARRAARGGGSRSVPAPLLAPALIAVGFLVLPLIGLLIRAPWGRIGAALSGADATQALILSLWTATTATAISLVVGVPLAWVLARSSFPGQRLLRALVTLPLVLPPVVGGVALLLAFGRTGFIGGSLNSWFGITLPFTPAAVVIERRPAARRRPHRLAGQGHRPDPARRRRPAHPRRQAAGAGGRGARRGRGALPEPGQPGLARGPPC